MAALTVYLSSTTASTVATAKKLVTTAPASSTSVTNKTAKVASGWGVLHTIAYSTTFAGAASEPAFGDVNGAILDDTSLEGLTIGSGTWSCSMRFSSSSGTLTGVIHIRMGKRSSSGVYTEIVNMACPSTGFTSAGQTVTATGTGAATDFTVGDKLYMQIDLQITSNTSSSNTATTSVFENGGAVESVATPGTSVTPATVTGAAALSATGTLTAAGAHTGLGAATLTAAATMTAAGTVTSAGPATVTGAAALSAAATLAAAGTRIRYGAAPLTAMAILHAAGTRTRAGAAVLSAHGTLTAAGLQTVSGRAALTARASLTAAASGGGPEPPCIPRTRERAKVF